MKKCKITKLDVTQIIGFFTSLKLMRRFRGEGQGKTINQEGARGGNAGYIKRQNPTADTNYRVKENSTPWSQWLLNRKQQCLHITNIQKNTYHQTNQHFFYAI